MKKLLIIKFSSIFSLLSIFSVAKANENNWRTKKLELKKELLRLDFKTQRIDLLNEQEKEELIFKLLNLSNENLELEENKQIGDKKYEDTMGSFSHSM